MTENNDKNEQEATIVLKAFEPLSDEEFKIKILQSVVVNNPEYFEEAALLNKLDMQKDAELVTEIVYIEQVQTIEALCRKAMLEENILEAYNVLHNVCFFEEQDYQYIAALEGENASDNLSSYIDKRLEKVSALKDTFGFISCISEAIAYTMTDSPNFNAYKANQIFEKISSYEDELSSEEKAQAYFIASKMYRKLNASNKLLTEGAAQNQELECLKKVLTNSADYKLISYCQDRIADKNDKVVIRAYKKALNMSQNKGNLFKINMKLADIYTAQTDKIGFNYPLGEKEISATKAIHFLMSAYAVAKRGDRLPVLKKMAHLYQKNNQWPEWKNIKTVIALKFLKGEERCYALTAIGDKLNEPSFYYQAIEESKKIRNKRAKNQVLYDAYTKLSLKLDDGEEKDNVLQNLHQLKQEKQAILLKTLKISNVND